MNEITIKRALELAVATEELGGRYYQDMAKRFGDNPQVAAIFEDLAAEEAHHEAEFRALVGQIESERPATDDVYYLLRAAALSEFFDPKKLEETSDIGTPAEALLMALAFEKSTLFFYQSLRDTLGPNPQLDELIAAEKSHVTRLTRLIVSDANYGGDLEPW